MQRLYPGGLRFLLPIPFSMPLQIGQSYKRLCEVSFGQSLTANLPLISVVLEFAFIPPYPLGWNFTSSNHLSPSKALSNHNRPQTNKPNQFQMPVHNLESPVHRGFLSEADKAWYLVVRRVTTIPGVQTQVYVQQTIQREANGEVPILPTGTIRANGGRNGY